MRREIFTRLKQAVQLEIKHQEYIPMVQCGNITFGTNTSVIRNDKQANFQAHHDFLVS